MSRFKKKFIRKFRAAVGILIILSLCSYMGYDRWQMQKQLIRDEMLIMMLKWNVEVYKQRSEMPCPPEEEAPLNPDGSLDI